MCSPARMHKSWPATSPMDTTRKSAKQDTRCRATIPASLRRCFRNSWSVSQNRFVTGHMEPYNPGIELLRRLRNPGTVPTAGLRFIQGCISGMEHGLGGCFAHPGIDSQADRDRLLLTQDLDWRATHCMANFLSHLKSSRFITPGDNTQEFFPAKPSDRIVGAHRGLDSVGDFA